MVEFAINNSVHASTTHTPFYENVLRHPRVPTLLECNSGLRGGGTRASKNRFGSRSSRSDEEVIVFNADIDNIDIEEDDASESAEALTEEDDPSESVEALTEENVDVAAVRSQRTEANESLDEFTLARETVVRFVQDSIAEAVDKQKQNADKNGRAKTLFYLIKVT
uniref:Reverse transcriptase domain-containing protein n=1 Tax=Peronospora matthiolae TaxID=2874970 RepID=A0AAV1T9G0_9STRA